MANMTPPASALGAAAGPGAPPPISPMAAAAAQHDTTTAVFQKMEAAKATLDKVRGAMDKLVALGPAVTADDVIEMGGTLVGAGLSAPAVAQILSTLPEGSDAIAQWVKEQDDGVKQREAALQQAHGATQHHMGLNALRVIAGHHLGGDDAMNGVPATPPGALGLPS